MEKLEKGLDENIVNYIKEIVNSLPINEELKEDKEASLLEYYNNIQWLQSRREFLKRDLDIISNTGIEHATILLATIISSTEEKLYIFSEKLNKEVTNLSIYKESLQKCIEENIEVKILLEREPDNTQTWGMIESSVRKGFNNISVKLLSKKGKEYLEKEFKNELPNFTTNLQMYRLEIDKQQMKAIGAFNKIDLCKILESRFIKAFDYSENYL